MPSLRRILIVVPCLALAGCGGASSTANSAGSSAAGGRCWPIAPLRLEALEHGREWESIIELRADGTVRRPGSDVVRATFTQSGDRDVLTFGRGEQKMTVSCGPDLVVDGGAKAKAKYDDADTLVDRRFRVVIDADGTVHMGEAEHGEQARIVGDVARARRTAAVLVLLAGGL